MDNVFKTLEVLDTTSFLRYSQSEQLDNILNPQGLDAAIQ